MKNNIERWETPVSDMKRLYFYDTCLFRTEESAVLIFAVCTENRVFEFTFKNPLAYLVHTEDIINGRLYSELSKVKPGFTFTVSESFLEEMLDSAVIQSYSSKSGLCRFYEIYYINNDDVAMSVMTQNVPEIREFPEDSYNEVRKSRYK